MGGNHPHTIARDLGGRVGVGGVREGGVLGIRMRLKGRQGLQSIRGYALG